MTEFDNDNWRAGVQQDYMGGGIRFALVQPFGDGRRRVLKSFDGTWNGDEIVEGNTLVENWHMLPEAAARALLDALSQHFGGTGDTRQMRRDLDAERKRVDKLTDALIKIATREHP